MKPQTRPARTYGQFCPVAAALDVVGDRWVLLILREMLFGRRRFSEIKRACPGIAPNLLSDRLRMLTERGMIDSQPGGYALTERGQAVGPVLRALAMFGVDHIDVENPATADPADVDALTLSRAFLTTYQQPSLGPIRVRVTAPDGSTRDIVKTADSPLATVTMSTGEPDVAIEVDAASLWLARRDQRPFECPMTGSPEAIERFITGFALEGLISPAG